MRWGSQPGYCVVGGQKIPLQRSRVREVPLQSRALGEHALCAMMIDARIFGISK